MRRGDIAIQNIISNIDGSSPWYFLERNGTQPDEHHLLLKHPVFSK
jgi:hypothetical protein